MYIEPAVFVWVYFEVIKGKKRAGEAFRQPHSPSFLKERKIPVAILQTVNGRPSDAILWSMKSSSSLRNRNDSLMSF